MSVLNGIYRLSLKCQAQIVYIQVHVLLICLFTRWLSRSGSIAIPSGFYSIVSRCMETVTSDPCPAARVEVLGILLPHKQPPVGSDTSVSCT